MLEKRRGCFRHLQVWRLVGLTPLDVRSKRMRQRAGGWDLEEGVVRIEQGWAAIDFQERTNIPGPATPEISKDGAENDFSDWNN